MSEEKSLQWVRSFDVAPYPNVWEEFEAKESRDSDKLVKYRIQDLPEDRFDDALQHMLDNYLVDEPISVSFDGINDKDYVDIYVQAWRRAMQQKVTLVCFREGCDEIVSLNVLIVHTNNDTFKKDLLQQCKSESMRNMCNMTRFCYEQFPLFDKFDVKSYIGCFGLSVNRKYRGLGLGTRMLQARSRLAAPFGLTLTASLFTSNFSNANADKAGFQLGVEYTFDELNEMRLDFHFENVQSEKVAIKTLTF